MARSLAFWLDIDDCSHPETDKNNVELHFNFWSLSKHKVNYLDIGVRITNPSNIKSINFYLPFDKETLIYEPKLSSKVCNNDDLISAVFNCPVQQKTPVTANGYCDVDFVRDVDNNIRFFTNLDISTSTENEGVKIKAESQDLLKKGCVISFFSSIFSHDEKRDSYFRFRIQLTKKDVDSIKTVDRPTYSAVTNNHEVTETVDFRINEIRNLPANVQRHINKVKCVQKLHFFLIRESRAEYKISHTNYKRCRILENDLWENYINIDQTRNPIKEQMLIYHWSTKEGEAVDHFSAFAKFSSKALRWPQIIAVLLVAILTGFIASMFTNYVWKNIEKPVGSVNTKMCESNSFDEKIPSDESSKNTLQQEGGSK